MRFTSAFLAAACAVVALAQSSTTTGPNPFTRTSYSGITAGVPINITWTPTTSGTVSLQLVEGISTNLKTVSTFAPTIANSGSFIWTPSTSLVKADDYALRIISDANPTVVNYTPQFAIDSTNTASPSSSSSAASSSTAAPSSSTASTHSTDSASSSTGTATGSTTATSSASTHATTSSSVSATKNSTSTATTTSASRTSSSSSFAVATAGVKVGGTLLGLMGAVMVAL